MEDLLNWLEGLVWNQYFIYAFLATGLFFTIASRFVQVVHIKDMFKYTFIGKSSKSGISSFQAISMSLGSRVGTGNIAGVATAIAFGGPGAVFWMWLMAFFGAATAFIETTLAQTYKSKVKGEYRGGTPYYIDKGLGLKKLAIAYALLVIVAKGFGLMNIQSNTIAVSMEEAWGIDPVFIGIFLVVLFSLVIFGGVKRIARTAEFMVPIMAIGYLIVTSIVLILNASAIPEVFSLIVSSAFGAEATFGGILGSAIAWGVQRGFFSNAAGSGGETFEGGAAEVSHPAKQGFVQSLGVYVDTWIICSATAFMILITGMFNVNPDNQEQAIFSNISDVEPGAVNVQMAVDNVLPGFGYTFLAIALFFFCFTTMMSYYYKAETSLTYLSTQWNFNINRMNMILKFPVIVFIFTGTIVTTGTAWTIGDIGLGSMAYLNMFALLLLFKPALKILKDFNEQKKMGKDPVFEPAKAGIKNADYWEAEVEEEERKAQ